ncbi:MAG: lamin tail domain-containing protein [Acidobacteriota bacterium]|nr:lamin tail domain-containing protein [Acidobacteriota bacterium]
MCRSVTRQIKNFTCSGIVINEIYGGGGNSGATFNQDYVELYNNGSVNVDISNYSLQYASATGAAATDTVASTFYARRSSTFSLLSYSYGLPTDYPTANWYVH